MSISPNIAYNIQNHGTDYNLATRGEGLATSNSRVYVWQATPCGSDDSVFLVDTLAQKCLWASGTSVAVHGCVVADKQWSLRPIDRSPNAYTIHSNVGNGGNFLSTNDQGSFNLVSNEATSYSQWSFQAPSSGGSVTWNVCDHISDLTVPSPSTEASSLRASVSITESAKMTTNSSLSTSNVVPSATSETLGTISEASTLNEQAQAESTTAATTGNSNTVSLQPGTETAQSASNPTPSGGSASQSNNGELTHITWSFLLAVLMASLVAHIS